MKKKIIAPVVALGLLTVGTSVYAHEVVKGDTLGEIAVKYNTSIDRLLELNPNIKDKNLIYIGDIIKTDDNGISNIRTNTNVNTNVNTNINTKATNSVTTSNYTGSLTAYEFDLLSRLVEAEAGVEPYKGKVAVANVVLNRVNSTQFPNTIHDVIHAKNQFTPVSTGTIYKEASEDSKQAVREAAAGVNYVPDALFFYDARIAKSRWLDSRETTNIIGNHTFKK